MPISLEDAVVEHPFHNNDSSMRHASTISNNAKLHSKSFYSTFKIVSSMGYDGKVMIQDS